MTKKEKLNLLFLIAYFLYSSLSFAVEKAVLRKPPSINHGHYLEHLLSNAYELLGYEVQFVELQRHKEIELVKSGKLIGALARDKSFSDIHPELIRVNVPLFEYELYLVSDRRVCGYCFFQQLPSVGYSSSGKIFGDILDELNLSSKKLPINDDQSIEQLLLSGELSAAIISNISLSKQLKDNPHFIFRKVAHGKDYHYLSPHFSHLEKDLAATLSEHEQLGLLPALRAKYNIELPKESSVKLPNKAIVVAGNWEEYTELDGTGVYWQIIKESLGTSVELELQASSWIRAERMFKSGKADILYGGYSSGVEEYPRSQLHIDYEYEVFAVAKSEQVLSEFAEKESGFRICAPSVLWHLLRRVSTANTVYNSEVCNSMLTGDRVDIMLEYEYNLFEDTVELPKQVFWQEEPLFAVFQNTPKGRALKEEFDASLAKLAKSGRLKLIFPDESEFDHAKVFISTP